MLPDWCSSWLASNSSSWRAREDRGVLGSRPGRPYPGLRAILATSVKAASENDQNQQQHQEVRHPDHLELDFSALNEAGTYGSVVADLHDALRAYQDGDLKLACVKCLKVAANLAGLEAGADFLSMVEEGTELRELYNTEQYLSMLSKLVRLIPPTGEPEIDIPLGVLRSLELVQLRQSWESAVAGDFRLAARQLGQAFLPPSFEEAARNTRPSTVAPVVAGLVAGYYGYRGRLGRGARSNFLLASFGCTAAIRMTRGYRAKVARSEVKGRPVLYTGWDEHLLLT